MTLRGRAAVLLALVVTGVAVAAPSASSNEVEPEGARAQAREILSEGRFRETSFPRPLRGPLRAIGEAIARPFDAIKDAIAALASGAPGGQPLLLAMLALVLLAALTLTVSGDLRRRERLAAAGPRGGSDPTARDASPRELERRAEQAERAGRLDEAVRLRFRAGLLRLDAEGAIRLRPSLTSSEVRRALGSQAFDRLAREFDQIAYGGRTARPDDVAHARREWPEVVAGARGR